MTEQAEAEQHDSTTVDVVIDNPDQAITPADNETPETPEEFDIVLAGQEEPTEQPSEQDPSKFILSRVKKREEKLKAENARLRQQQEQYQAPQPEIPVQQPQTFLEPEPDEYAFDDRNQYLQARATWQQNMLRSVVSEQLNQQQNGHRQAARAQQDQQALEQYANNAAKLKVRDFNEVQDAAFDVLGDQFAQMIARELPDEAPKLMYWFGKNPQEAVNYRDNYQSNPGSTTFQLGKLAGKLTLKRRESKAPQPERNIENGSVGGVNRDWAAEYKRLEDTMTDDNHAKVGKQLRELRKEARKSGFDVSAL